MNESIRAVVSLLAIIGTLGCFLVFATDRVNLAAFFGFLTLTIASLVIVFWSLYRRDKAPDLLKDMPGSALERDGFCFKLIVKSLKGRCYLDLYFQGRYERPCRAMVVLQPSKGFFLVRPGLASMTLEIDCPAGGFGVTSVPWPVGRAFQGKIQSLDVGGDVFYPAGRGKMIRYRGGLQIGTAGFNKWNAILTVAGALGGVMVLSRAAKVNLKLPTDVEESVEDDLPITTEILWKIGDDRDRPSIKKSNSADPDF